MALTISTNSASLVAQAAQSRTNSEMETSMERLSTGKRINAARDDAAGLGIATRMESQVKGITMAMKNAADSQALMNTAEGAQAEVSNILQRIREVAIQASNDTNVAADRVGLQTEVNQLIAEMDRIASQTTWNGMSVLDGTFSDKKFQIGAEAGQNITLSLDSVASSVLGNYAVNSTVQMSNVNGGGILADTYTLVGPEGSTTVTTVAGESAKEFAARVNGAAGSTGITANAVTKLKLDSLTAADSIALTINGTTTATVAVTSTTDLRGLRDAVNAKSGTTGVTASLHEGSNAALQLVDADGDDISVILVAATATTELQLTALDKDGATAQSKASENLTITLLGSNHTDAAAATESGKGEAVFITGQATLSSYDAFNVQVAQDGVAADVDGLGANNLKGDGEFFGTGGAAVVTTDNGALTTVSTIDVSTRTGAENALNVIDGALDKINNQRAKLGAMSNRIDHTVSNLQSVKINTEASQGRIQDADFAAETSNLVRAQILSQAATAMLAQANASKQSVLTLLQG